MKRLGTAMVAAGAAIVVAWSAVGVFAQEEPRGTATGPGTGVALGCGQQAYEGWSPLSWVGGTVVGSAPQVKALLNANVSPDTDWDAAARLRSGEWQIVFRNAPLASMNTFRDAYTTLPFYLFVVNPNGTDYGNGC